MAHIPLVPGCCRSGPELKMSCDETPPKRGYIVRTCCGCGKFAGFVWSGEPPLPRWVATYSMREAAIACCEATIKFTEKETTNGNERS